MPYGRRRRYPKRARKGTLKRRTRRPRKLRVPRPVGVLGRTAKRVLRYQQVKHQYAAPQSTGGSTQVWRANGLFDVDISGGGHQPRGFDEMMSFFDHFHVIGAKITVRMVDQNSTKEGTLITLWVADTSTVPTLYSDFSERRSMKTALLPGNGNSGVRTLSHGFSSKRQFGKSPLDDNTQQGDATANPSEGAYFMVNVSNSGVGTFLDPVETYTTIDYITVFTEAKQIGPS